MMCQLFKTARTKVGVFSILSVFQRFSPNLTPIKSLRKQLLVMLA